MSPGNTMPKTCAPHAIENLEGINLLGTAFIKTDSYIQWACAKHAT